MVVHIIGFMYTPEPQPHEMIFCGTFFGFMLISFMATFGICMGSKIPVLLEAILAMLGFTLFTVCSIVSMYHAENDQHLMYLTDMEEWYHPFFHISRLQVKSLWIICQFVRRRSLIYPYLFFQSIVSLTAALIFLMHGIFAIDILVIRVRTSTIDLTG